MTWRCCYIDLGLELPPPGQGIGEIDHPVLRKAQELLDSFPLNLVRIQEIRDTLVYRFTHGRLRVAVWLEEERGILWICAVDERDEDTYDFIVRLHEDGELLPGEDDVLREEVEAAARFAAAVQADVPRWLRAAREVPGEEQRYGLPGESEVRFFIRSGEVEEVWVAMPTLASAGGLTPRMRGLVLATIQNALGESEWEQRYEWPTGELPNHEVAYLGLR
jgi:hypothetical protein